jgi:RNA polymerase sigma-70 factor (ECF subfamily)
VNSGPAADIIKGMGYLRLVHSAAPAPAPENACVDAFDRELDYIFATLQRMGAAPHEAEDLAQDVFMVLHRHWDSLEKDRPMRPYLFGVAFRIMCAHRRKRGREIPCAEIEAHDGTVSPEGKLLDKQSRALLLAALEALPLPRRAVVVMHDLDDIPIVDIARNLSISRFGAYARLHKGRKELAAAVRRLSRGEARL